MDQIKVSISQEKTPAVEIYLKSLADFLLREVGKVRTYKGNENGNDKQKSKME